MLTRLYSVVLTWVSLFSFRFPHYNPDFVDIMSLSIYIDAFNSLRLAFKTKSIAGSVPRFADAEGGPSHLLFGIR